MKKNKRLLYTLENVPEKYLEEALEKNIKRRKIQWRPLFAAAACISVIAAVPYLLHTASRKSLNHSDLTSDSTFTDNAETFSDNNTEPDISQNEITDNPEKKIKRAYIDYSEFNWSSCLNEGEAVPDMNYYYISDRITDEDSERISPYKIVNGYFCIDFLKDKVFEKQINDDIKNISDQMLAQKDSYENFDIYSPAADGDYYDSPFNNGGLTIKPSVQNGYFEVYIGLASKDKIKIEYLTVDVLRYDLIKQKKIESIDEYASDGLTMENILDKCGSLLKQTYRTDDKMIFGSFMENSSDFDRSLSGFSYLVRKNEDGSLTAVETRRLKISNYLEPYKSRDFSSVIDEEIFICENDKYFNITNEIIPAHMILDGKSADYWLCGPSRFYTEEQIMKMNNTYSKYYDAAFKYLADNYPDESSFSLEKSDLSDKLFRKNLFIISQPYTVYIDSETSEVIDRMDAIFTAEGQEYIMDMLRTHEQNIDSGNVKFFIQPYSDESPDCCRITIGFNGVMINDAYALDLDVPFSMMNSRYFDTEKYKD